MTEFSFTSYVEVIRPFLMKNSSAEDAAMFLMDSIASQLDAEEDKKKKDIRKDGTLKKILRGIAMVPEELRLASAKKTVVEGVQKYFHVEVLQDLNPHLRADAVEAFRKFISGDDTIPDSRKEKMLALLDGEDFAAFLADSFIYAINRPCTKTIQDGHQKISIPHLIFTLIYGLGIYLSTLITIIVTGEFS